MRNGKIIDILTSVDIQEIVKVGGEVIKFSKFTKGKWNQEREIKRIKRLCCTEKFPVQGRRNV